MLSNIELMCVACYSIFTRDDRLNSEGVCWYCVGCMEETG